MIRTVVIVLTLTLMLQAAIQPSFARDQETMENHIRSLSGSKKGEQPVKPQRSKPTVWPQPFKPSEEVGADSQVSFPTDI